MSLRIGAGSDAVGSASRLAGHHSFLSLSGSSSGAFTWLLLTGEDAQDFYRQGVQQVGLTVSIHGWLKVTPLRSWGAGGCW